MSSDLDEVAAGVIEHGGGDRTHGGGFLGESHPLSEEPSVFPADVLYGEHHERNPVGGERVLERANGRVLVGLENQLGAIGSSGDTTVSQRYSPRGTSSFLTKPSTSV
jgi:hypothetical protein